jgi:hypothetical protein
VPERDEGLWTRFVDPAILVSLATGLLTGVGYVYYRSFLFRLKVAGQAFTLSSDAYLFKGIQYALVVAAVTLLMLGLERWLDRRYEQRRGKTPELSRGKLRVRNVLLDLPLYAAIVSAVYALYDLRPLLAGLPVDEVAIVLYAIVTLLALLRWNLRGDYSSFVEDALVGPERVTRARGMVGVVAVLLIFAGSQGIRAANDLEHRPLVVMHLQDGVPDGVAGLDNRSLWLVEHNNGFYYVIEPSAQENHTLLAIREDAAATVEYPPSNQSVVQAFLRDLLPRAAAP